VTYRIKMSKLAEKNMGHLPDRVVKRIDRRLTSLSAEPYAGTRKLSSDPAFRVRVGDYRIIYDIDDQARNVTILSVTHRREAYR
jgi:mRNA interferase RelE/StbE